MPGPAASAIVTAADTHIGNGSFALGMAEKLATGDFKGAAIQGGWRLAFTPKLYEAAAVLAKEVAPAAKTLGFISKNLPIIGGVVLAVYDAKEVYDHVRKGDYKGAGVALAAGAAEVAATTAFGGLAGAAAREVIVEGVAAAGGPRVNDAALVALAKQTIRLGAKAYDDGSKYVAGLTHDPARLAAEQSAVLHVSGMLPKTAKLNGRDVPLEAALRDPGFNNAFREGILHAEHQGHFDAKPMLAQLDIFDALERQRTAALAQQHAHAPAAAAHPSAPRATAHA